MVKIIGKIRKTGNSYVLPVPKSFILGEVLDLKQEHTFELVEKTNKNMEKIKEQSRNPAFENAVNDIWNRNHKTPSTIIFKYTASTLLN